MTQIRDKETERDSGAWSNLSETERQTAENEFRHMGMIARFRNVLAMETVRALGMLTQEIQEIFLHDVLVERLASMLNYFLVHLVRNTQSHNVYICLYFPSDCCGFSGRKRQEEVESEECGEVLVQTGSTGERHLQNIPQLQGTGRVLCGCLQRWQVRNFVLSTV